MKSLALAAVLDTALVGCGRGAGDGRAESSGPATDSQAAARAVEVVGAAASDHSNVLQLSADSCNAALVASVEETDAEVRVDITTSSPENGLECLDSIVVELERPLAGQAIIDASTGRPVPIEPLQISS